MLELLVVAARGKAHAKDSNFEFNKIIVLNIGDAAFYLCLKRTDPNHKCFHL